MNSLPIIFSHYGNVDYLAKSLLCSSITNPTKRKILIGDASNKYTALVNGWEHVLFQDVKSPVRDDFNKNFVYVRGKHHSIRKNDGDWLKFVFERWYIIQQFCKQEGIERFWHFDSDVMVLEDLRVFEPDLINNFAYTTQCNGMCLNGMVGLDILTGFCLYTTALFQDKEFIALQQLEFDTLNPAYAFTEMRAFEKYASSSECHGKGQHLAGSFTGWWFDDCICQDHQFEMENCLLAQRPIKKILFDSGGFYGRRLGVDFRFGALNLSWVPTLLFDWVLANVLNMQNTVSTRSVTLANWKEC